MTRYPYSNQPKSKIDAKQASNGSKEAEEYALWLQEMGRISHSKKQTEPQSPVPLLRTGMPGKSEWESIAGGNGLSMRKPSIPSDMPRSIDKIPVLSQAIVTNLMKSGIQQNHAIMVGRYLTGAYLSRLPLFLVGRPAEQVADSLSLAVSGQYPAVIHVPGSFGDLASLIRAIETSDASIVVIRNAAEFLDQDLFLQLSEEVGDKHLLFSLSLRESLQLLSPSVFGYAGVVDCELCWKYLQVPSLAVSKYIGAVETGYNKKMQDSFTNLLDKYVKTLQLHNGYGMNRSIMLTQLFENQDIPNLEANEYTYIFPLLHELYVISIILEKKKEFLSLLESLPNKSAYNLLMTMEDKRIGL